MTPNSFSDSKESVANLVATSVMMGMIKISNVKVNWSNFTANGHLLVSGAVSGSMVRRVCWNRCIKFASLFLILILVVVLIRSAKV